MSGELALPPLVIFAAMAALSLGIARRALLGIDERAPAPRIGHEAEPRPLTS